MRIALLLFVLLAYPVSAQLATYQAGPGISSSDGTKATTFDLGPTLSVDFTVVASKSDLRELGWRPVCLSASASAYRALATARSTRGCSSRPSEVRVICPQCAKAKLTSTVRGGQDVASVRLLYYHVDSYYDEDGRHHLHGGAPPATRAYTCSRGHKWTTTDPKIPCWCGHE